MRHPGREESFVAAVHIPLSHQVDVAGFHSEAARLLAQQVPPREIRWAASPAQSVDEEPLDGERAAIRNRAARAIVPQSFIRMSELVVLHREADRFELLYRTLWRLVYEPDLRQDFGDDDLARLRQMAQAVRRDIQKMKLKLAFRPIAVKGREIDVAWYEPAHYVCEAVGAWLAKKDPKRHWLILTPDRSICWDGRRLVSAPAVAPFPQGADEPRDEDLGRTLAALPWT